MPFFTHLLNDPLRRRWPTLTNVMFSRLLLLIVLLAGLAVLLPEWEPGFYVFIGMAFAVTIPYALWLRGEETAVASARYQFMIDVLIITGLVHFSGGLRSELSLLYPLVILVAGIIMSGREALLVALFSILVYAVLILMEMEGFLVYRGVDPSPYSDYSSVIRELMLRVVIFSFFAAAASFITDRCFFQDKQLKRLQAVGQLIFDNVAAPLLGVQKDGRIMLLNSAAQRLLGTGSVELKGTVVTTFFPKFTQALAEIGKEEKIWHVLRRDGQSVPCLIELELAKVPLFGIESSPVSAAESELYLMIFHDMTDLLRDEQEKRTQSNLNAAAGMINEIAHEVRNPLTAIKSAGELLSQTADAVAKQRRAVSSGDWDMINSMCSVISEETNRLDQKVQFFVECASRDPSRLATLMDDANHWLKRVSANGSRDHE